MLWPTPGSTGCPYCIGDELLPRKAIHYFDDHYQRMAHDWAQERICVEKLLPEQEGIMDHFRSISTSEGHYHALRAAFVKDKKWPSDATITIGFIGDGSKIKRTPLSQIEEERGYGGKTAPIDPLQKKVDGMKVTDAIKLIVQERIQPLVGVKLVFKEDDPASAQIRIGFDSSGGSYSLVGKDCLSSKDRTTMNFGWFDVATVMHEFGHALGMIHEHQNPRGEGINWDVEKVYAWAESTQGWDKKTTDQNILKRYDISQINGSSYDPLSIMLYFFPANLTKDGQGTAENLRLSPIDVEWLAKEYSGGQQTPAQFYQQAYGESTSAALSAYPHSGGKHKWVTWLIVILAVAAAGIGIFFWMRDKKGKRRHRRR
jgi:hypothetical protein